MNTLLPFLNLPPQLDGQSPIVAEASSLKLDRRTYDRALACNNCGLCLPVCPTYQQTGLEGEGPRGRIQLMRGLSDGKIEPGGKVRQHLDSCLNCRGCEAACPEGVVFHELLEETRDRLGRYDRQHPCVFESYQPILRWFIQNVLVHPRRLKLTVAAVRILQRIGVYQFLVRLRVLELLPPALQRMEQLLPEVGPIWPEPLPMYTGAKGMDAVLIALQNTALLGHPGERHRRLFPNAKTPRKTVGFFAGCIGSVACDPVNRQAIELLAACGAEVYAPASQGCCGAIHQSGGNCGGARDLARRNIDLFIPRDGQPVDYIVTNIAGCGAMLRQYDILLRDDPDYSGLARLFGQRLRDIMQLLAELELPAMRYRVNLTAAYHESCHAAQGRELGEDSRRLLGQISGLKLTPLAGSDQCCGAAGVYNLTQPEMASSLADQTLDRLAATGAQTLVSSNIGCAMHLQSQARRRGQPLRIVHPVELIHQAVFGLGSLPHGADPGDVIPQLQGKLLASPGKFVA